MNKYINSFLVTWCFVLMLVSQFSNAEDGTLKVEVLHLAPNQAPAIATLEDIAWIRGLWSGAIEDRCQEHYVSEIGGDQMGGYARGWHHDGSPWFYEITLFVETDNSLEQQVRHFGPDMRAWEKDGHHLRRPLVKKTDNALYFDGITFVNKSPSEHLVYFKIPDANGSGKTIVIHQYRLEPNKQGQQGSPCGSPLL